MGVEMRHSDCISDRDFIDYVHDLHVYDNKCVKPHPSATFEKRAAFK